MAEKSDTDEAARLAIVTSFRLSEGDHAAYRAKVVASGLTKSEFFREHVLTNTTQIIAAKRASLEAKKMLYLFSTVSNNINQLAHRINADHQTGKNSESTYSNLLDSLDAINTHFRRVLKNVD